MIGNCTLSARTNRTSEMSNVKGHKASFNKYQRTENTILYPNAIKQEINFMTF